MKLAGRLLLFLLLITAGCSIHRIQADLAHQVDVFGIEFYSGADYREIGGVKGVDEPCLKGYERSFDSLDITIGYGFDKRVRKITTRNGGTELFGVRPGMTADEGKRLAVRAGLVEVSARRFVNSAVSLTLLVDAQGRVFGVTLEALD